MPIIGKLIKKTTEINYKRNFNKGKDYINQLNTLQKNIDKSKKTAFGVAHKFHEILNQEDLVELYQVHVPITEYESFYNAWLKDSIAGNKDHTWPGRIKHYALSSGTTGSPSKRIPVTEEMIRSFQKTSLRQTSTLHELDLPESFFTASILAVGGSASLVKKDTHIEGDLSGILKNQAGTFYSNEGGTVQFNKLIKDVDFDNKDNVAMEAEPLGFSAVIETDAT
jgi:hypothetical protein